jgi:hypothetical protein
MYSAYFSSLRVEPHRDFPTSRNLLIFFISADLIYFGNPPGIKEIRAPNAIEFVILRAKNRNSRRRCFTQDF